MVQRGMAPGSERSEAGLTAKRLDPLGTAMLAISDEGMDVSSGDPAVRALLIRTGVALGVHADGALPGGFSPHARDVQEQAVALHPTRQWSRDDRQGNQAECVV